MHKYLPIFAILLAIIAAVESCPCEPPPPEAELQCKKKYLILVRIQYENIDLINNQRIYGFHKIHDLEHPFPLGPSFLEIHTPIDPDHCGFVFELGHDYLIAGDYFNNHLVLSTCNSYVQKWLLPPTSEESIIELEKIKKNCASIHA